MKTENIEKLAIISNGPKVAIWIKKNGIVAKYDEACHAKGITSQVVSTIVKDENLPSTKYPPHHCIIIECKMKPSINIK